MTCLVHIFPQKPVLSPYLFFTCPVCRIYLPVQPSICTYNIDLCPIFSSYLSFQVPFRLFFCNDTIKVYFILRNFVAIKYLHTIFNKWLECFDIDWTVTTPPQTSSGWVRNTNTTCWWQKRQVRGQRHTSPTMGTPTRQCPHLSICGGQCQPWTTNVQRFLKTSGRRRISGTACRRFWDGKLKTPRNWEFCTWRWCRRS